jgi:hypothetical protein
MPMRVRVSSVRICGQCGNMVRNPGRKYSGVLAEALMLSTELKSSSDSHIGELT